VVLVQDFLKVPMPQNEEKLIIKPSALIFSDVNYTSNKKGSSKAFELTRAFFGYEYLFSMNILSLRIGSVIILLSTIYLSIQ
jgi:hypothetical protein